jgi:hypothetical protein
MRTTTRLCAAAALAGATLLAAATTQSASAQPVYDAYGRPVHRQARPYDPYGRPLTVVRRYPRSGIVAPTYSPYDGPQAIVTAPLAAASTLVALPFRVINSVFPPYGNPGQNPLVLVGAPVHFAGEIAQLPFRAAQAPFGGWGYQSYDGY